MKTILEQLYRHEHLGREQAKNLLADIARERYTPVEVAALLGAFNMRGITIDELKGFRDGMLELCRTVNLADYPVMDVCGTGGDGKNTFNISTLGAFVVAGAGIPVAKHGNFGVSSVSGSSNVMAFLGIPFRDDGDGLKRQLDKAGLCFIHAPLFHPGMRCVAPVRKQLATKTFFNMLGPLVNPAQPKCQLVGLYDPHLLRMYQYIFQDEEKRFCLVHTVSGYDEVSLTADLRCINNRGERYYARHEISPFEITDEDLHGGNTVEQAAHIFVNVLRGNGTAAQNEVVLINSALAIQAYRPELDLETARQMAADSLYGHRALEKFNLLKHA